MSSTPTKPPKRLQTALEIAPEDWDATDVYHLVTALVIPRPIGWISTVSNDGIDNVAPHSYFNVVAHRPPHVVFSSVGVKDTVANIRDNNQFVVNLVTFDLVEHMNFTATDFPPTEDEFAWSGLQKAAARRIRPKRVAQAKAHFECEAVQITKAGNGHIVIGRVLHIHVDDSVWRDGRVDPYLLDPVCRLSGSGYARLGTRFRLPRPTWEQVQNTAGTEAMPRLHEAPAPSDMGDGPTQNRRR